MNLVRRVQTEYSSFIKDILYYIPLAETISSRKKLNYDQLMDYTLSQYDYLQGQEGSLQLREPSYRVLWKSIHLMIYGKN